MLMANTSYNLIDRTYEDWDPPINHIEHKIKLLLVMQGYKRSDIHFRGEVTSRYLRYGYWREIQPNDLDYVSVHSGIEIEICELYDDDCGLLLSYEIKGGIMKVSNCCGAPFYEPGYPDNDICSACKEHADAVDEEE